jgi:quaternary ammonium compound-resistance protein SugE
MAALARQNGVQTCKAGENTAHVACIDVSSTAATSQGDCSALLVGYFRRMAWTYLLLAGFFEIGWPVGLKMAQGEGQRFVGIALAIGCMGLSGFLLWLAQRDIPIGTSYAVWTGIGAAGTFLLGVMFYGDAATLGRYLGAGLIIAGVATLKLAH